MKLYATITSERATKGQGGQWLEISVKNADKQEIMAFKIEDNLKTTVYTCHRNISKEFSDMYNAQPLGAKGEKQKGEKIIPCGKCGRLTYYVSEVGNRCERCNNL